MKRKTLSILGCPDCHAVQTFAGQDTGRVTSDALTCPHCQGTYPVVNGFPHFTEAQDLPGFNCQFSRTSDLPAWAYRAFSEIAFTYIRRYKETGRREVTDWLQLKGGSVLEVSIDPDVNLPCRMNRAGGGEGFGLDIPLGLLARTGTRRLGQQHPSPDEWGFFDPPVSRLASDRWMAPPFCLLKPVRLFSFRLGE